MERRVQRDMAYLPARKTAGAGCAVAADSTPACGAVLLDSDDHGVRAGQVFDAVEFPHRTGVLARGCAPWAGSEAGSRVGEEAVADAADGEQVLWVGGVVLDIAAEADDEVVDGAGVSVFADVPHLLEDG